MSSFPLKPTHKPVKAYYEALAQFQRHGHTTEGNTRPAFADLLKKCAPAYHWHLVEEFQFKGTGKQSLRADGALIDELTLQHGLWEAKDTDDKLEDEIKKKRAAGYPLLNTLFQSPDHAVLYQNSGVVFNGPITDPEKLIELLEAFFNHAQPDIPDWKDAVEKFSGKIADLAGGVRKILAEEEARNAKFRENYAAFADLCQQSINPDLTDDAIRNMLVQHLLTERIFRKVFNNPEFLSRNVIAAEIEKVIRSITARYFSRDEFLKPLDHFYRAIERAAEAQQEYTEKQHFLNAVYEKFFQNFDRKQADTHGIVYTPQPIVDFMVRSVEEILRQEFGKSLSDSGVHILDPFTGTGNFITRIMREIKRSKLPQKYAEELHCNEIMLLPYYIASMNIEHEYMQRAAEYRTFEGICLADTFDTTGQSGLFSAENTKRIKKQMSSPIRVVVGNPPYNMGQADEADAAKNRAYRAEGGIDSRVAKTYTAASRATLRNKLSDPYVKAFRWATDRIEDHGIVCFVTNNSFIDQIAFDGMRSHLEKDFSQIYLVDLGGNIRKNPELSGTTHNVFGIQVGVAITLLVRRPSNDIQVGANIKYASVPIDWRKTRKLTQLEEWTSTANVEWQVLQPTAKHTWLVNGVEEQFESLIPLVEKQTKKRDEPLAVFEMFGLGVTTNRDLYTYNFCKAAVESSMKDSIAAYTESLAVYRMLGEPKPNPDEFIDLSDPRIKWTRQTKESLKRGEQTRYHPAALRTSLYRPFTTKTIYFDAFWNEEQYKTPFMFPTETSANTVICVPPVGARADNWVFASSILPNLNLMSLDAAQCLAFFSYGKDGTNRRENITDWTLAQFRTHYADDSITKWDIFHAVYAVLHHPEYRTRYAANLKRELPRIPFPPGIDAFHAFAKAGKRLMELHIDYEKQKEYPLEEIENPKEQVSFRVEKMKLSKDKSELRYNDFLTLRGIPAAAFDYRLGNRSALEWVIDQYRVSTDARSGIVNDPNRADDPTYILRLIRQVITVSLETQAIVAALPGLGLPE